AAREGVIATGTVAQRDEEVRDCDQISFDKLAVGGAYRHAARLIIDRNLIRDAGDVHTEREQPGMNATATGHHDTALKHARRVARADPLQIALDGVASGAVAIEVDATPRGIADQ